MGPEDRRQKPWYGEGLPYLRVGPLPGHLIVIEGTDGVGRSTQIELLRPWLELEGHAVSNTGWTRYRRSMRGPSSLPTGTCTRRSRGTA